MTHVAITGASSGIGAALVAEFVGAGAQVTLVARRQAEMVALAARVGGDTQIFAVDLCDVPRACDWLAPAAARFGPIDILINNAGMQLVEPAVEHEPAGLDAMMALNLVTPMRLVSAVLPEMLKRRSGTIVDVASAAALTPPPGMWGYSASKAGLAAADECLRAELRGSGVQVLTVYPGPVDTPLATRGYAGYPPWVRSAAQALMLEGTAPELARRIRTAIELEQPTLIYPLPYLFVRWFPGLAQWVMSRAVPPIPSRKQLPR
jgi:short-subunit dehydrogenase